MSQESWTAPWAQPSASQAASGEALCEALRIRMVIYEPTRAMLSLPVKHVSEELMGILLLVAPEPRDNLPDSLE